MSAGNDFAVDRRTNSKAAGGGMTPTVPVPMDRPAPTLTGKAGGQWVFLRNRRDSEGWIAEHGERPDRPACDPAPTITGEAHRWMWERPATTVCGDPRLSPPGYRGRPDDYEDDGTYTGERSMDKAIKLSLAEALTLQTFRPDYPVQGNKGKQFEQVGNAVPPLLAAHLIGALTGRAIDTEESHA